MKINFSMAFVDLVFQVLFGLMVVLSSMVPVESLVAIEPAVIKGDGNSSAKEETRRNSPLSIVVRKDGTIHLADATFKTAHDLKGAISQYHENRYSAVSLRVDKSTPYEVFLQVLSIVKQELPTLKIELKYLEKGD